MTDLSHDLRISREALAAAEARTFSAEAESELRRTLLVDAINERGELREKISAAEQRAAEAERRFTEEEERASQAVKFLGRIGEELVNAGFSGGDRDVTLGNVRSLIADCRQAWKEAEEAERACAAMRAVLMRQVGTIEPSMGPRWVECGYCGANMTLDESGGRLEQEAALKHKPDCALHSDAGSGWLSPEQGAEKDARIERLTEALGFARLRTAVPAVVAKIDRALAARPTEVRDGDDH